MTATPAPVTSPVVGVDHVRLFRSLPTSYMVLDRDLVYVELTDSYCATTGRSREELIGQYVFEAFPPTSDAVDETGVSQVQRSFERARDSGVVDTMPMQRYDIPDPVNGGMSERYWSLISVPIFDADGQVRFIAQRAEDVTDWVRERDSGRIERERSAELDRRIQEVEVDLYARAHELEAALAAREVATAHVASLASVALELTGAETVEDLSRIVFGRGLPVLGADGGAVSVRDDDAGVVRLAVSDTLGEHVQVAYGELPLDSPLPAAHVARTGETVLLPTRESGLRWSPLTEQVYETTQRYAWATVPLRVGDRLLGALAVSWVDERAFSPDELGLLEGFAAQVSQALQRIRASEAEREAAQAAARMSETLQRSLLTEPPQVPGLSIAVRYQPAAQDAQVGGDWYDVVVGQDGSTLLVVGDVSGHDRTAAAAMGQFRNLLRGIAFESADGPAALLTRLDRASEWLRLDALATAVLARVERPGPSGTRLRWSNAGHLPPVLRTADGAISVLTTGSDLLLGLQPDTARTEHVVDLTRGSTLVLFTDGVVERRDDTLDAGVQRVVDALAVPGSGDAERVADAVIATAEGSNEDDIAVLVVQVV